MTMLPVVSGQRFMRSSDVDEEFEMEMEMEDDEKLSGMSREMFIMQRLSWELQPPKLTTTTTVSSSNSKELDARVKRHVQSFLASPVKLKLQTRKGKYGLRAVGILENGKKLRGFWRQAVTGRQTTVKSTDYLSAKYDDAVRNRLLTIEFELQLPPIGKEKKLPSVVYQFALEPGSMNTKAMIPRGSGRVLVYPTGHDGDPCVEAGTCNVGMTMRAGLVDPTWARGRPFFRKGRSPGVV